MVDGTPFFLRSKSDSVSSTSTVGSFTSYKSYTSEKGRDDSLLPSLHHQKPRIRIRALLSHCHYRRVIIWTLTVPVLASITLVSRRADTRNAGLFSLISLRVGDGRQSTDKESAKYEEDQKNHNTLHWLKYKHLDGYYAGLKTLVHISEHKPEFPLADGQQPATTTVMLSEVPQPTPYVAHPEYESREYTERYHPVRPRHLDREGKVPAPDLARGHVRGVDTERSGSTEVWRRTGRIAYRRVDWGDAQERCVEANRGRFYSASEREEMEEELLLLEARRRKEARKNSSSSKGKNPDGKQKLERIAVVIRTYVGFEWTQHAILNFRAMVSELSLRSGAEYGVHFLLHVKDDDSPVWADAETAQRVLDESVPAEFHGLCTLWSEAQMRLLYPGDFGGAVENPSGGGIHGVYRSAHMPLQHFAMLHPGYAHYWNWEMDMRYLGSYYELFDRLGAWAKVQGREQLWERSAKYYIPALHGSWQNFTELVAAETRAAGRRAVMGPVYFQGRERIRAEEQGASFLPESCSSQHRGGAGGGGLKKNTDLAADERNQKGDHGDAGDDKKSQEQEQRQKCGVGEEADLITLNPLFDADESGWVFAQDVTGYDRSRPTPPRRCAIVTASRLSRRLVSVMHEETWRLRHSMFSEMFPASMALHHGLKAAYAPHPVFLDRGWDVDAVDASFNGGRRRSTDGHGSPFDFALEHNHKGTSWYYNSEFAGLLWRRCLGYAMMDGRGSDGGRDGEGTLRGGRKEEEESPCRAGGSV